MADILNNDDELQRIASGGPRPGSGVMSASMSAPMTVQNEDLDPELQRIISGAQAAPQEAATPTPTPTPTQEEISPPRPAQVYQLPGDSLRAAGPEERIPDKQEPAWYEKAWQMFSLTELERRAREENALTISRDMGMPAFLVMENYEQISRDWARKQGVPVDLTFREYTYMMMDLSIPLIITLAPQVAAARILQTKGEAALAEYVAPRFFLTLPEAARLGIGIGTFMSLAEAESYAIQKINQARGLQSTGYQFGAGKGFADLFPNATEGTRNFIDIVDFFGKAVATGALIKKGGEFGEAVRDKYMRDVFEQYDMPKTVYVPSEKFALAREELGPGGMGELIRDLNLDTRGWKDAMKYGYDIEIPGVKISTITDKPWWATLKKYIGVKPFSETTETRIGKLGGRRHVAGLLESPEAMMSRIPEEVLNADMGGGRTVRQFFVDLNDIVGERGSVAREKGVLAPEVQAKREAVARDFAGLVAKAKETGRDIFAVAKDYGIPAEAVRGAMRDYMASGVPGAATASGPASADTSSGDMGRPIQSVSAMLPPGTQAALRQIYDLMPASGESTIRTKSPSNAANLTSVDSIGEPPLAANINPAELQVKKISTYLEQAKQELPGLRSALDEVANAIGGATELRVKKPDHVVEKIERKQRKDAGFTADHVGDYLGSRIVVPDPLHSIGQVVEGLHDRGFTVLREQNMIEAPSSFGYRAIHLDVLTPAGFLAEVQVHFPEGRAIISKSHKLYGKWRSYSGNVPVEMRDAYRADHATNRKWWTEAYNAFVAKMKDQRGSFSTKEKELRKVVDPFYSALVQVTNDPAMPKKAQSIEKWLQTKGVKPLEIAEMGVKKWLKTNTDQNGLIDRAAFREHVRANQIVLEAFPKFQDNPGGEPVEYQEAFRGYLDQEAVRSSTLTLRNDLRTLEQANLVIAVSPDGDKIMFAPDVDGPYGGDFISEWESEVVEYAKAIGYDDPQALELYESVTRITELFGRWHGEYRIGGSDTTKHSQWVLPGGKNYMELVLALPVPVRDTGMISKPDAIRELTEGGVVYGVDWNGQWDIIETQEDIEGYNGFSLDPESVSLGKLKEEREYQQQRFKTSHWDELDTVVHARKNDREVGGKKVYFIEEIQSDRHQTAIGKGGYYDEAAVAYLREESARLDILAKDPDKLPESKAWGDYQLDMIAKYNDVGWYVHATATEKGELKRLESIYKARMDELRERNKEIIKTLDALSVRPPWAPLAENWHEYMMKRLLRDAAENGYDTIAWTTGKQQADRYDLAKQIDSLNYDPYNKRLIAMKDGKRVMDDTVAPENLPDHIGKETARKLIASPVNGAGNHQLSGLDLEVGGEGMRTWYDEKIPGFLARYVKPFGGKVGKISLTDDIAVHSVDITPAMRDEVLYKGQTFYSGVDPTQIIPVLKGLRDNVKEAMPHLEELGRGAYEGAGQSYRAWSAKMKTTLGDLWESFKGAMRDIWNQMVAKIMEERGSVSGRKSTLGKQTFDEVNDLFRRAAKDVSRDPLPPGADYDALQVRAARTAIENYEGRIRRKEKASMDALKRDAKSAVAEDPTYRMMDDIVRRGGINGPSLRKSYDKHTVGELSRKRIGLVTNEGPVWLDKYAQEMGYEYADDLMSEFLDVPSKKEAVDKYVDDFINRYEELREPDYTDLYVAMLDEEANLMRKLTKGYAPTSAKGIKREIRQRTGQIKASDAEVTEYDALIAGMKKAQIASRAAWTAGRREGAITEKERHIAIAEKFRERVKAREEVKDIRNGIVRIMRNKALPEEYRQKVQEVLEGYDLVPRGPSTQRNLESLATFLKRHEESGEAATIPQELLDRVAKVPWSELTIDQMRDIYDSVKMIQHLGRLKKKLLARKQRRDFETTVNGILAEWDKNWPRPKGADDVPHVPQPIFDSDRSALERGRRSASGYMAELVKPEYMFRELDKWADLGLTWEEFFKPFVDAQRVEDIRGAEIMTRLEAAFKPFTAGLLSGARWAGEKVYIPGIPQPQPLTKEKIIMVALNSGNEGNRNALMSGLRWEDSQIERVTATLSPEEWKLVHDIWGIIDDLYPALNQTYKALTGVELRKIEGQYFPLVFDRDMAWRADKFAMEAEDKLFFQNIYTKPSVTTGATHARVGGRMAPLLSFTVIFKHIKDVNHYATHAVPVRDVYKLAVDPHIRSRFTEILGEEKYKQILPWLQNIAKPRTEPASKTEKIIQRIRQNATIVGLGLKFSVAAQQPLSLTQTIDELGLTNTLAAMSKFYVSPLETARFVAEKSPMMVRRWKSWDRELEMAMSKINPSSAGLHPRMIEGCFWLISALDMCSAYPTWTAAYKVAMEEKWPGDEGKAVDYADMVVGKTQAVVAPKDMSGVQRHGEVQKLFTMFYTFFSSQINQILERKAQFREGEKNTWELFKSFFWIVLVPAIVSEYIKERRELSWGELGTAVVTYQAAGYPFIRDIVSGIMTDYDYRFSPVTQGPEAATKFGREVIKSRQYLLRQSQDYPDWKRMGKWGFATAGYAFGLPTAQAMITMEGILDLAEGRTEDPTRLMFREPRVK